jgi:hypothetical protein
MTKAKDILETAIKLQTGDRAATHGDVLKNHEHIAALWNGYLGAQLVEPITPHQALLLMAQLKMARTKLGEHNLDDYVDAAAYIAMAGEIAERLYKKPNAKDHGRVPMRKIYTIYDSEDGSSAFDAFGFFTD